MPKTQSKFPLRLIVGLCNPGAQYELTRHNAGAWLLEELSRAYPLSWRIEKKFLGAVACYTVEGNPLWFLMPSTYMNLSGRSVLALAKFYKIPLESVLVAHDELDLPPGVARLKQAGGHGGHNGLRSIMEVFGGNRNFWRLRIGIGHPGDRSEVTNYVLGKPSLADKQRIAQAIDESVRVLPELVSGASQQAIQKLHSAL